MITLEADPKHAEVARANFALAGLADVIELRLGPALETLPKLAAEGRGPFDLIFIDADKSNMREYFDWALKLSRPGSVIIADNVIRNGAVLDAAAATRRSRCPALQRAARRREARVRHGNPNRWQQGLRRLRLGSSQFHLLAPVSIAAVFLTLCAARKYTSKFGKLPGIRQSGLTNTTPRPS